MKNYQFYLLKFNSDRLKESKYKISISFNEAKQNKELIAIADSQLLRTVRDITGKIVDLNEIHILHKMKNKLKENHEIDLQSLKEVRRIQFEINRNLYIPDIVSIVVKHPSHYRYLAKHGFQISQNVHGKEKTRTFKRLSCSAGQARNSTVIFCNVEIIDEVKRRINNNRNLTVPVSPSKFNAYFGLCSTATKLVTEPRFVVVPDYENEISFMCNYVTETDWDIDDIVEKKEVNLKMNRTDGMGLISPRLAHQWSLDLLVLFFCII